jgi:hypothetical protein
MELWKKIKYYPNYEVSNLGNVRRILKSGKTRQLKAVDNGNGYMRLNLYNNRVQSKHYIHRLVANAFISNSKNLPEVHHIDHDKTNNTVTNLAWVTSEENNSHKVVHYRKLNNRNKVRVVNANT